MKRKILITFIIIFLIAELAFLLGKYIDFGRSNTEISKKLSTVIGADINVKGRIELKFLPLPKLVISHIRIRNYKLGQYHLNIRASEMVSSISILKFLGGNIEFHDIAINNAALDLVTIATTENDQVSTNKISKLLGSNSKLSQVSFYDSNLNIINSNDNSSKKYKDFNFNAYIDNQINVTGSFATVTDKFQFAGTIKENNLGGGLESDFKVNFSDNILTYAAQKDQLNNTTGNISITGKNLKRFIFNNLFPIWFLYPDSSSSNFTINLNFENNANNLKITNGEIKGDDIEGYFIGDIKNGDIGDINLKFKNFNLNTLLTKQKKSYAIEEMKYRNIQEGKGNFPLLAAKQNIFITGTLENITINQNEFGPVKLGFLLDENRKLTVEHLNFKLSDDSSSNITGVFNIENDQYNFTGKYFSQGENLNHMINKLLKDVTLDNNIVQDYDLAADFKLDSNNINIYNISSTIANEGSITGKILINLSEAEDEKSLIDLNIDNFDLSKLLFLNQHNKHRHILHYIYENLSSREQGDSLLREFLWLRNLYLNIDLITNFTNFKYNNSYFDKATLKANLTHRELNIKEFSMISPQNDFKVTTIINLDEKQPYCNIDIAAKKIDLEFLTYEPQYRSKVLNWSKDLLVIPNFKNMDVVIKAKIDNLNYADLALSNNEIYLDVRDNILEIKNAKGDIDAGKYNISGNLILDGLPTLNLNYDLTKFKIGKFIKLFFDIPYFSATANWAGSLYSSGNTPYIMMKQLKSKNNFYLADIKIDHLAIPKITQEIANLSSNPQNSFITPLEKMILNGNTKFKNSNGVLNIKNGIILIDNIKFETPNIKSVVAGKIDLVNFAMKLNSIFTFTAFYKLRNEIKKTAVNVTHSLEGEFDNLKSSFNLFQLQSFVTQLKNNYLKLYEQIQNSPSKN